MDPIDDGGRRAHVEMHNLGSVFYMDESWIGLLFQGGGVAIGGGSF